MATNINLLPGSAVCVKEQDLYRRSCCDPTYNPLPVVQSPTASPGSNYPQGNEPVCDLCMDGSYPTKPNTVTAVLYIPGNPTCQDLYWMGLSGNIADYMCYPLQDYMQEPCGCITNTAPTGGGGEAPKIASPTPSPVDNSYYQKSALDTKTDTKLSNAGARDYNNYFNGGGRRHLKGSRQMKGEKFANV